MCYPTELNSQPFGFIETFSVYYQADLELAMTQPLPSKCWDYRCVPPCLASITILIKSGENHQSCLVPNFKSFIFSHESNHGTHLCIESPAPVPVDVWEEEGELGGPAG
jgi:hypothetical protein